MSNNALVFLDDTPLKSEAVLLGEAVNLAWEMKKKKIHLDNKTLLQCRSYYNFQEKADD